MRKFSLLLIASGVISLSASAQTKESYADNYSTLSGGLDVGLNHFAGDLSGFYKDSNLSGHNLGFGASLYLNKWANHFFGFSGSLGFNTYAGKNMDIYFKSTELNGALDLQINISSIINKGSGERKWAWIPYFGFGLSSSLPKTYASNDAVIFDRTDRYSEAVARAGLLVKYKLNDSWDLDMRYLGYTTLFSDWSDNVTSGSANDAINQIRVGVTYNFKSAAGHGSIAYASPINDLANQVAALDEKVTAMSTDSDGDGVSDFMDADDNTPKGYVVDGSGRAMDVDRDGIPDDIDQDPFTPRGAKVDATGRELDSDGDGVADSRDLEPNTPAGKLVNFQGREIKGGMGDAATNAFLPDIFYGFNSARLTSANEQRLFTIAKIMMADESIKMEVIGRTDPVGSEKYNLNLSQRRAQAVVDALVNTYGISADRFEVKGLGESSQTGSNKDINRRVEFRLK